MSNFKGDLYVKGDVILSKDGYEMQDGDLFIDGVLKVDGYIYSKTKNSSVNITGNLICSEDVIAKDIYLNK
jgi:hypothetical protein